uniref:Uncharacterized protein n=1 Tax=Nelumbo nucifera TaxID=4432 RepID=A0A822YWV6_NELNU|nr:TPA_asm: hypothetical protein HUJ06_012885 [Nelumbo nucifera]
MSTDLNTNPSFRNKSRPQNGLLCNQNDLQASYFQRKGGKEVYHLVILPFFEDHLVRISNIKDNYHVCCIFWTLMQSNLIFSVGEEHHE